MKARTKAECDFQGIVAGLPCIVCGAYEIEIHHMKSKADGSKWGHGQRGDHMRVLPLCKFHHWNGANNPMGSKEFERRYGTENELFALMLSRLGMEAA